MSLTAVERETIITTCDEDDFWTVYTCQRRMVTQLLKNPNAEIVDDFNHEGTRHLTVKVPANAITVRKVGKRKASTTTRKREMTNTAKCQGVKADGSKCGSVTLGDTGFCRHHQDQKK